MTIFRFNLSHTADAAIIAVTRRFGEVGIDVERIRMDTKCHGTGRAVLFRS